MFLEKINELPSEGSSYFRKVKLKSGNFAKLLHNHEAMTTDCLQTAKRFPIGHQPRE